MRQTKEEWRIVFYISAAVYAFGTIFFLVFSTGVKQPWADPNGYDSLSETNEEELALMNEHGEQDEHDKEPLNKNANKGELDEPNEYESKGL